MQLFYHFRLSVENYGGEVAEDRIVLFRRPYSGLRCTLGLTFTNPGSQPLC